MSESRCQKCGSRLIPDPGQLDRFMCSKCGAKHSTVWQSNEPHAGVS